MAYCDCGIELTDINGYRCPKCPDTPAPKDRRGEYSRPCDHDEYELTCWMCNEAWALAERQRAVDADIAHGELVADLKSLLSEAREKVVAGMMRTSFGSRDTKGLLARIDGHLAGSQLKIVCKSCGEELLNEHGNLREIHDKCWMEQPMPEEVDR